MLGTVGGSVDVGQTTASVVNTHLRKVAVEIVNWALNHDWFFRSLGAANRRWGFLESIFLAYPASEDYALNYAYAYRLETNRWKPWPTGVLRQDGRWILMLAIGATEAHFRTAENRCHLHALAEHVERLRMMTHTSRATFAGVLPGLFARHGVRRETPEGDTTAHIVSRAIARVRAAHPVTEVVVLGAAGFVGRRVMRTVEGDPHVHGVDLTNTAERPPRSGSWLVVNIANRHALDDWLDALEPGDVVLNEVYPPPGRKMRDELQDRHVSLYHVVGVEASAWPSFPSAYAGAIPCCAALPSQDANVVLRSLTHPHTTTNAAPGNHRSPSATGSTRHDGPMDWRRSS